MKNRTSTTTCVKLGKAAGETWDDNDLGRGRMKDRRDRARRYQRLLFWVSWPDTNTNRSSSEPLVDETAGDLSWLEVTVSMSDRSSGPSTTRPSSRKTDTRPVEARGELGDNGGGGAGRTVWTGSTLKSAMAGASQLTTGPTMPQPADVDGAVVNRRLSRRPLISDHNGRHELARHDAIQGAFNWKALLDS